MLIRISPAEGRFLDRNKRCQAIPSAFTNPNVRERFPRRVNFPKLRTVLYCVNTQTTRDKITQTVFPDIGLGSPWHTHQPLNILYISTPGTTYSRLASVTNCCSCNLSAFQNVRFRKWEVSIPLHNRCDELRSHLKKRAPRRQRRTKRSSSPDSLEPAIDGPPSPERIRAYTEQMKRSSIFGNNSRTNTFSSATSSSRSRESTVPSTDNLSLSRRSSNRSNTSSMPSVRSERPESVAIFGSIFSRAGRKGRRDTDAGLNRSSSSLAISTLEESASEEGSARERYYGKGRSSRRKQLISGPYNFQHVTHTRQEHLPNLERASRMQLASEFSAVRDSQLPTHGELKGIRAEDLHFENFSSEALNDVSGHAAPAPKSPESPRQRSVLRKSITPPQPQRMISYAKSHDNLRSAPPRPPRSPLSHACPVAPPARTSSRTASILFDTFDPLSHDHY
jgi:hypothetical protein